MSTDMEIRAEYTGYDPDLRPAASAFARMFRNKVNPDGTFTDEALEAEFQEWIKQRQEKGA